MTWEHFKSENPEAESIQAKADILLIATTLCHEGKISKNTFDQIHTKLGKIKTTLNPLEMVNNLFGDGRVFSKRQGPSQTSNRLVQIFESTVPIRINGQDYTVKATQMG